MLPLPELLAGPGVSSDYLIFDVRGELIDVPVSSRFGSASLLVTPVTEATKVVSHGRITESLDRDQVYEVVGFALSGVVCRRMDAVEMTVPELKEAVTGLGLVWSVTEIPYAL